jgi:hypothetical protein
LIVLAKSDTSQSTGIAMLLAFYHEYSLKQWFGDASAELWHYFITMTPTHWMIISACAVFFGFLCLRGTGIKAG